MSVEKFTFTKESSNFTILPNNVLQNLTDPMALGLWCYLSSLPANWEIYRDKLQEHFSLGRDRLKKLFALLKKCNLLEIKSTRSISGQVEGWHIHVKNGSEFEPVDQKTENQSCGKTRRLKNQAPGKTTPIKEIQKTKETNIIIGKDFFDLPDCIKPEDWKDFVAHRKSLKAPLTAKAMQLVVNSLLALYASGENVQKVIEQSILNGWKGVFPVAKENNKGTRNGNKRKTATELFYNDLEATITRGYNPDEDPLM